MKRDPISPRKRPKQDRSRETVVTILAAAKQILSQEGFDHLTTNRLAEKAGVSIGSLYQYFPNKQAIVAALLHDRVGQNLEGVRAALESMASRPTPEALRGVSALIVEGTRREVEVYRELLLTAPAIDRMESLRASAQDGEAALEAFLSSRADIHPTARRLGSFLLARAIPAIVHGLALDRPDLLEDETFEQELALMMSSYLTAERDP